MNNEEMTTITDECVVIGAPRIIQKNGGYLLSIIQRVVENYDSNDFDRVAFLADIQLGIDNCRVITDAAELLEEALKKLRHEVTDNYNSNGNE